jgi:hypothetical protein
MDKSGLKKRRFDNENGAQGKKQKQIVQPIASNREDSVFSTSQVNIPRKYTVSIAVPGSIIDNCQSLELKTYVAGQVCIVIIDFSVKVHPFATLMK